jgi:hypothetical protein
MAYPRVEQGPPASSSALCGRYGWCAPYVIGRGYDSPEGCFVEENIDAGVPHLKINCIDCRKNEFRTEI